MTINYMLCKYSFGLFFFWRKSGTVVVVGVPDVFFALRVDWLFDFFEERKKAPKQTLCIIAAPTPPASLLRCPKDLRISPPPGSCAEKRKQVLIILLVLLCRYVRYVISIPCFVPQHSIPTPSLPYPHSVPLVSSGSFSPATKAKHIAWCLLYVSHYSGLFNLAKVADFAVFYFPTTT